MPEHSPGQLPDFPDLAARVAQATVPPPFEQIVDRARRRRRRRALGSVAVVAVAVAAVATGATLVAGQDSTAPQPVKPSPTAASPSPRSGQVDAATVVRRGTLQTFAANDTAVLTIWALCPPREAADCASAWQLADGTTIHRGMLPKPASVAAATLTHDFVISLAPTDVVVHPDGTTTTTEVGSDRVPRAGDVVVPDASKQVSHVVDPATATWFKTPVPPGTHSVESAATIDDSGALWTAAVSRRTTLDAWSLRSGRWHQQRILSDPTSLANTVAAAMSSSDRRIAVSLDAAIEGDPTSFAGPLLVSSDAGTTWRLLRRTDVPFPIVREMATTVSGSLFVLDGQGRVFRSTDASWSAFAEVPTPAGVVLSLRSAGHHVLALWGRGPHLQSRQELWSIDDQGNGAAVALR